MATGEAVAIKQIKLTDLPKSELRMMEVSLVQHGKIQDTSTIHHPHLTSNLGRC